MKALLAVAIPSLLTVALTQTGVAQIVLDESFDGATYSATVNYAGFDRFSSAELGVKVTIQGTGNLVVTKLRVPVSAVSPGTDDPSIFSFFLRGDAANIPANILGSLTLDSRVLGPQSAPLVLDFDSPIPVAGGQSYWLTLEPNKLGTVPTFGANAINWNYIATANDVNSYNAFRSGVPGVIPSGSWQLSIGRSRAFQLLGVPEPQTIVLLVWSLFGYSFFCRTMR
jgi:hypothetical protein